MFDWVNNIFNSIVEWFNFTSNNNQNQKHLEYLDLDDDFFKECPVLTDEQIYLSQSMPNLKDHYKLIEEEMDEENQSE